MWREVVLISSVRTGSQRLARRTAKRAERLWVLCLILISTEDDVAVFPRDYIVPASCSLSSSLLPTFRQGYRGHSLQKGMFPARKISPPDDTFRTDVTTDCFANAELVEKVCDEVLKGTWRHYAVFDPLAPIPAKTVECFITADDTRRIECTKCQALGAHSPCSQSPCSLYFSAQQRALERRTRTRTKT